MFKPEYIMDNIAVFGYYEAYKIMVKQLKRMGKCDRIAYVIATGLMESTIKTK